MNKKILIMLVAGLVILVVAVSFITAIIKQYESEPRNRPSSGGKPARDFTRQAPVDEQQNAGDKAVESESEGPVDAGQPLLQ